LCYNEQIAPKKTCSAIYKQKSLSSIQKILVALAATSAINLSQQRLYHLAATFGCSVGSLPFTYLGLPLNLQKPLVEDCLPLVLRIERRLISTSLFLSHGGNLQLVNSVLSSMETFYMCSIKIPVTIIKQIDKYRRHCLWRGGDINSKKPLLTA
jgi:hypothetical protein